MRGKLTRGESGHLFSHDLPVADITLVTLLLSVGAYLGRAQVICSIFSQIHL